MRWRSPARRSNIGVMKTRVFSAAAAASFLIIAGLSSGSLGAGPEAPEVVRVPAGAFIEGSDRAEREYAYRIDEQAYGHSTTRKQKWYENEPPRRQATLPEFHIMKTLVTNEMYAAFLAATGHPPPDVDRATWEGYGLIHPYKRSRKFAWTDGKIPAGRETHPVVMVSWHDARAYAAWLSNTTGQTWRLPDEQLSEKACRGTDGRYFPWGNTYEPKRLNSHDAGPFETVPVARYPEGASPYGVLDATGQVFEWTSAANPDRPGRYMVRTGSWDDKGCGICRCAARHSRPENIKHILVGFRLVRGVK